MSHEINIVNGIAEMGYVGQKPWHGLGQELTPGSPIEVWAEEAGLDWRADEHELFYFDANNQLAYVDNKKALIRADTGQTLSVVSHEYNVVQPQEILEFYRSLIDAQGYTLETAGVLMGGRRVWALARTGQDFILPGDDRTESYLLLATSYDGSMATSVSRTAVRVVCWNTMTLAIGEDGKRAEKRIPHAATFNPDMVKGELGLESNEAWENYQERAKELARRKVSKEEAIQFFLDVFYPTHEEDETFDIDSVGVQKRMETMLSLYTNGVGQQTKAANGTAWGLLNAVTRYADHERATRTTDARLNRAWFGDGRKTKFLAMAKAEELIAA